jgi:hypothetical protein
LALHAASAQNKAGTVLLGYGAEYLRGLIAAGTLSFTSAPQA